jgi:hypothetical protein
LVDDRYVSAFSEPGTLRYSINCLLGLKRAALQGVDAPLVGEVDTLVERFLEQHYHQIEGLGDLGLLLVLLSDHFERGLASRALRRIEEATERGATNTLPLQDVCWMLWGAVALARRNVDAQPLAQKIFRTLHRDFLYRDSLLPRHTCYPWRRNVVSFGGIVYFLRAIHEYSDFFGDEYAASLFRFAVTRVQGIQGPRGEWPWLIDVKAAVPIDVYPIYSVHQDSMAMLFLLPALDLGVPGVRESITRSYGWILGDNEISTPMIVEGPFFRYRSLERRGGLQRPRRAMRSLPGLVNVSRRFPEGGSKVRVNEECRSYEMGWILFAWAGRSETLGMRAGEQPIEFG